LQNECHMLPLGLMQCTKIYGGNCPVTFWDIEF